MNKFINKVNSNYDSLDASITKILNPDGEYQIRKDPDDKNIIMIENYLTKELLMTAKYNYIGIYNTKKKIWYWGWSLIKDKKLIEKSLIIKKKINKKLKHLVEKNNIIIEEEDIPELIKISLYLMKDIWYFAQPLDNNIIQFISIENILEKYI